jgi:DNA-directed RNA polymerase specialized sigma24 family protein
VSIKEIDIPQHIKQGKYDLIVPLLYKNVLPLVQRYVRKNNGNKEDAFDVFHDAILIFYKQVLTNQLTVGDNVYGYLYKISIHNWLNKLKRDKKIQYSDTLPEPMTMDNVSNNSNERSLTIEKILNQTGDKCKEVLHYSLFTEVLLEDVQLYLNYPSVSALKMQIMRCKQKLKSYLEENPHLIERLKEKI